MWESKGLVVSEMQELKNLENSHLAVLLVDSIFQRGCPTFEPHCKTLPSVSNQRHTKVRVLFSYIRVFFPPLSNEAHGSDLGHWPSESQVDDGLEMRMRRGVLEKVFSASHCVLYKHLRDGAGLISPVLRILLDIST